MPTNNAIDTGKPIEVANGGTGAATFTAYSVLAAGTGATNPFQNVSGVGTTGQNLNSSGAGALPIWASSGYTKKIQTQTANNSASLAFTTGIAAPFNTFILVVQDCQPANNSTSIQLQISTDGGATYINTNYVGGYSYGATTYGYGAGSAFTTCFELILNQQSAAQGPSAAGGVYYLSNFTNGGRPSINGLSVFSSLGLNYTGTSFGYNSNANPNAFQIIASAGNITVGTFTLYGLVES